MKRVAAACLVLLAGCAAPAPPPGTLAPQERLLQTVMPGHTTKAKLLAAFGPTRHIRFDSGYEVWLYQSPAAGGRFSEFVILLDPQGVVGKTRQRPPR